ncbi:MAG: hypothetical protein EU530_07520 [Promethearchaeota archaeon]|nr:MAG: hypothetical protein EU530_07520 [Candidatus Lokiarchaeota archaeon]
MRRHTTHFRKNQVKGLLLFSIITFTVFIGGSFLTPSVNSPTSDLSVPNSASSLDIPWSGTGDPESARAYIQKSDSAASQTDDFDISVPTSPSILYSADMNFTILSGYETTHEFEQDSPLNYPRSHENSRKNPNWSAIESLSTDSWMLVSGVENGLSGGYEGLVDTSVATALILEDTTISPADNIVTFEYTANFTGVTNYDRLKTIGFRVLVDRSITKDVSAKVYLYNYNSMGWDLLYTENWDNAQTIETIILTNTRIAHLNSNNEVQIRLELIDRDAFTVTYRDLKVEALIAVQAPLSTIHYAAMEFDVRGDVNVSGIFAWVRTLTPSVPGADLILELYDANQSAIRSVVTSATKINLEPNLTSLISNNTITNFDTDEYIFIPFKSDFSNVQLTVGNYFAVLSSDTSNIYSVVTLPYDGVGQDNDPDSIIDHLFLSSDNNRTSWEKITSGGGQVDAAPFAINITRPYLPEEIDMKIDGNDVISYINKDGVYENTSGYAWGLGKWGYEFVSIYEDISNTITVPIEFNTTLISNLDFDVVYSVVAYAKEATTTNYYVELNGLPSWEVNYTLNQGAYTGWNYLNSTFALPTDWIVEELLDTNYDSLMDDLVATQGDEYNEYWIEEDLDGVYSLNATSPNYVFEMNTYLQFDEHYWETNGFMRGDNISISLEILNYSTPTSQIFLGGSECEVYDPTNTLLAPLTMIDVNPDSTEAKIVDNENILATVYEFDSVNILNTTGATPQGEYSFVFKWNYGNEVGYKVLPVFVMEYGVDISDISEDLDKQVDVVRSTIASNLTTADTYNVSLFAIEDLTGAGIDDEYHVNDSSGYYYTEHGFNMNVAQILVNESLLNPGETVTVNITFENYNFYWANEVTINAQFIQSTNYEWVVMEASNSVVLGMLGSGTENSSMELQFTVPSDYKGLNSPIRLNPFVLKLGVNINGTTLNPIFIDSIFPFIEKTENEFEGRVWADSLIHYRPGPLGKVFSAEVNRVEELVYTEATYLMQISDSFFVTCTVSEYDTFITKPIAQFNDITALNLVWGNEFQLQGTLTDEFGAFIDNQEISVEVKDGVDWVEYNQTTEAPLETNADGFFTGTYDSTLINKSNHMELRLSWGGNTTIFGVTTEYELGMLTYNNQIQIEIINSTDQIFLKEKQENTIRIKITNIGNSTLKEITVDFDFLGISPSNIKIGTLSSDGQLDPYESMYMEYYVTIPGSYQGDTGVITVSVDCESHESGEIVEVESIFELNVLTTSFLDNLDTFLKTIFFIGLIALVLGAISYGFKTRRKLQEAPQKKEERPRRGRYVEVAKLQKQPVESEEVVEEDVAEKTADLDDLLKEEGLKD